LLNADRSGAKINMRPPNVAQLGNTRACCIGQFEKELVLSYAMFSDRVEESLKLLLLERFRQRDWSARRVKFQTLARTLRHVSELVVVQSVSSN